MHPAPTPAASPAQHLQQMERAISIVRALILGDEVSEDDRDHLRSLTLTEMDLAFCDRGVCDLFAAQGVENFMLVPITAASLFLVLNAAPAIGTMHGVFGAADSDGVLFEVHVSASRKGTLQ